MADSLRHLTPPGELRAPVGEAVQLEFPELGESATGLAVDLWSEGLYVAAARSKPPGTKIEFALRLGTRSSQITGRGEVAWVRSRDESAARPAGMEIRFLELGRTARTAIKRWIGKHGEQVVAEPPQEDATSIDEELQAGVAALRAIFGGQGEQPAGPSTEAELARAKATLLEARRRSEALVDELGGRLDETQARLDEAQSRLDQLSRSSADQARLLEKASTARDAAERRAEELEHQRTDLTSELETAREELVTVRGSLAAANDTQDTQAGRIGELESSLATAEASWRSADADLQRMTESRDGLKTELRTLMSQHRIVERELEAANARADQLERQTLESQATLQGRLESLHASADVAEKARADLVRRLEQAAAERAHVDEQLDAVSNQATRLTEELQGKRASQEAQGRRIEELETSLTAATAASREATDRLREMAEAQENLEHQHASLESKGDELQGELLASQQESHRLQLAARETEAALQARLEALETGLRTAESARDELAGRLEEGIAAHATTEQQAAELTAERARLRSLVETARTEIKRLEKALREAAGRERQQARATEELKRSLTSAESAAAEDSQRLAEMTAKRGALEQENAALTLARSELEKELLSVQEELSRSRQEQLGAELALERDLPGLQEKLAKAQQDGSYLKRRLEEMRNARTDDNQRMLDAVASRGSLEKALDDARARATGLEETLSAALENVEEQEAKLQEVGGSLAAAEAMSQEAAERLEELIRSRDSLLDEHASLKADHDRLQGELDGVIEERGAFLRQTKEAETTLHREVERLQAELGSTIEARADLERRLEEESQARAGAEQRARDGATQVEQLVSNLDSTRVQTAQLEEALAASCQDLDGQNRRVTELQTELQAVRSVSDRDRRQAEATQNTLLESLEALQAESAAATEAQDELRLRREEEAQSRTDLERERTALGATIEKQRLELGQAQQGHDELRRQTEQTEAALRRDVEALELERDGMHEALNAARQQDEERARRIEELQRSLAAAESASAESLARLTETARSRETLSEERSRLQQARIDLERLLKASRAETATVQRQADEKETALRSAVDALEGELGTATAAQSDLTRRLEEATAARDAARAKSQELDVELGRLGSKLQSAQREVDRLASVPPEAPPEAAAKQRRIHPKMVGWLVLLAVVASLAVAWLLVKGQGDDAAHSPASERDQARSRPTVRDSVQVAALGAEEARREVVSQRPAEAGPPARPTPPGEPEEAAGPDRQRILDTLETWAKSWSEQRVDDYLALYSPEFRSAEGRSFEAWSGLRRQRILEPAFIDVALDQIEVEALGPDRATARFVQSYSSDSFNDQVVKLLELRRYEQGWRIVAEQAAP